MRSTLFVTRLDTCVGNATSSEIFFERGRERDDEIRVAVEVELQFLELGSSNRWFSIADTARIESGHRSRSSKTHGRRLTTESASLGQGREELGRGGDDHVGGDEQPLRDERASGEAQVVEDSFGEPSVWCHVAPDANDLDPSYDLTMEKSILIPGIDLPSGKVRGASDHRDISAHRHPLPAVFEGAGRGGVRFGWEVVREEQDLGQTGRGVLG